MDEEEVSRGESEAVWDGRIGEDTVMAPERIRKKDRNV